MNLSLIQLLHLCSFVFPTGVFSHSYGYETLLEDGFADSSESFMEYLIAVLKSGSAKAESAIVRFCYEQPERNRYWDELCTALKPAKELRNASVRTGKAFFRAFQSMYPENNIFFERLSDFNYAPVFSCACKSLDISLQSAIEAFLLSTVISSTSVAVRIIPLGQLDGQKIIRDCYESIVTCARKILEVQEEDVFSFSPMVDISSMRHEEQYSRMYMS